MCTFSVRGRSSSISEKLKSEPLKWTRPGLFLAERDPGVRRDQRVEAAGDLEVARRGSRDGRSARPARFVAVVVDGLDAVAVRVEQEAAVVVGAEVGVARARRRRGTRRPRRPARRPERRHATARGSRRGAPASTRARRRSAPSPSPPTRRARRLRGSARIPTRTARCGRSARMRRGPRRRCRRGRTSHRGYPCSSGAPAVTFARRRSSYEQ